MMEAVSPGIRLSLSWDVPLLWPARLGGGASPLTVLIKGMRGCPARGYRSSLLPSAVSQCCPPLPRDLPCMLSLCRGSSAQSASGLPTSPENLSRGSLQPPANPWSQGLATPVPFIAVFTCQQEGRGRRKSGKEAVAIGRCLQQLEPEQLTVTVGEAHNVLGNFYHFFAQWPGCPDNFPRCALHS